MTATSVPLIRPGGTRSVVVREATPADADDVVRLVAAMGGLSSPSVEAGLRRVFCLPWQSADVSPGFVLDHGKTVVGFLGGLAHTRRIRGRRHDICNLTSWYVQGEYRSHSLKLAVRTLSRKNTTFTVLTANATASKIWRRFGFQTLETQQRIVYPMPTLRKLCPRPAIVTGDLAKRLSSESLEIYRDHQGLPCEHALVERDGRQCYLVALRKAKRAIPYARILYLSEPSLFVECLRSIAGSLCRKFRVGALRVEGRFLRDVRIPFSKRRVLKYPQLVKSNCLEAEDVNALYSELVVSGS